MALAGIGAAVQARRDDWCRGAAVIAADRARKDRLGLSFQRAAASPLSLGAGSPATDDAATDGNLPDAAAA